MSISKIFANGRLFIGKIRSGTRSGKTFAIAATSFNTNTESTSAFPNSYAYYNLYINGILQPAVVSTITTDRSFIIIHDGNTLNPDTPVVLEFIMN